MKLKIKSLLEVYNIIPKKRLGQNFCSDEDLLKRMIKYSNLNNEDIVLEIGAGLGILTELLSKVACKVIAVESDPKLVEVLHNRLAHYKNVIIIEGNILKSCLPFFNKIIANPPYSISSPLLHMIFKKKIECAVLTLQEDFVKRLLAEKGCKEYGSLSVISYYKAKIRCLETVPMDSFYPQPKVVSNVILLEPQNPPFFIIDEPLFFNLIKILFNQRNKKLKNPLENFISKKKGIKRREARLLIEGLPYLEFKVYELAPEEFGVISNEAHYIIKYKRISFEAKIFYIFPDVYEPSDDTFMLAKWVIAEKTRRVLDVGTGCGILAILAAETTNNVVAIDINLQAIECTKLNAKINHLSNRIKALQGDLFDGINEKFDLIICNPPYLPIMKNCCEDLYAKTWDGGPSGREVIERFLNEAPKFLERGGKILMVQSSLSNVAKTIKMLNKMGFQTKILSEEKFEFEKLVVIQAIFNN